MTPSAVAEGLLVDRAQVSRMVRDLEAAGLITREPDPHSPNEFRCNQVVKNIDAFHEAFGTREGDPMWLAPEERVTIW